MAWLRDLLYLGIPVRSIPGWVSFIFLEVELSREIRLNWG